MDTPTTRRQPPEPKIPDESRIIAGLNGEGAIEKTIAGRNYLIHPRVGRKNSRMFRLRVGPIIEKVENLAPMIALWAGRLPGKTVALEEHHIQSAASLGRQMLTSEYDDLLDIAYDWIPAMKEDKEYLEENGSDEEFLEVFFAILKTVYGPLLEKVGIRLGENSPEETEEEVIEMPQENPETIVPMISTP